MKKSTMWVSSVNGKSVHLVDMSTPHPKNPNERFFLDISPAEAEKGISKEVPANEFFMRACASPNPLLIQVTAPKKREDEPKKKEGAK